MSLTWNGAAVTAAMQAEVNKRLEIATLLVLRNAKQLCPVSPGGGNLRNSIASEVDKKNMTGRVGSVVTYAPYVELGTRFMRSQSYLRASLINNKAKINSLFGAAFPMRIIEYERLTMVFSWKTIT